MPKSSPPGIIKVNLILSYKLLGDTAYIAQTYPFIITPKRDNGALTVDDQQLNARISRGRVVVEQAFGRLKCKWRRLRDLSNTRVGHHGPAGVAVVVDEVEKEAPSSASVASVLCRGVFCQGVGPLTKASGLKTTTPLAVPITGKSISWRLCQGVVDPRPKTCCGGPSAAGEHSRGRCSLTMALLLSSTTTALRVKKRKKLCTCCAERMLVCPTMMSCRVFGGLLGHLASSPSATALPAARLIGTQRWSSHNHSR
ncbi:hypothetical protein AAFF_G00083570 [Aldrovandia affinis]|uniref:DDE Tnp4 domain-containing protein n=1 Tax=Aldrovandia affinis TaxID=143900 RepID=A0AAD7R3L8_9TELE|nr:hypothetical protein AAFF_G00083570 [Aldrovandia affinis]